MSDTGRRYPVEFRWQTVELVRAGPLSERADVVLAAFIEISAGPALACRYRYPRLARNPLTRALLMARFLARRLCI